MSNPLQLTGVYTREGLGPLDSRDDQPIETPDKAYVTGWSHVDVLERNEENCFLDEENCFLDEENCFLAQPPHLPPPPQECALVRGKPVTGLKLERRGREGSTHNPTRLFRKNFLPSPYWTVGFVSLDQDRKSEDLPVTSEHAGAAMMQSLVPCITLTSQSTPTHHSPPLRLS